MATEQRDQELKVMGATIQGFAQACINLNIVAGTTAGSLIADLEPTAWYPFERLREIERVVLHSYEGAGQILERVGVEMMMGWYHFGPGKEIVKRGVDFLHFQSGSEGYASVVHGPEEEVGAFTLREIDEDNGTALIHSTDPFNKDLERGVIIGGMSAPGDLDYIDVDNSDDPAYFHVRFSRQQTDKEIDPERVDQIVGDDSLPERIELTPEETAKILRRYKGALKQRERDTAFWAATNENLKIAYEKLDEKERELAKAYDIIQDDLAVASRVQSTLLPQPQERLSDQFEVGIYHKQLTEVGGDYYDFFRTTTGRDAVGVFDISGHGVSAALVMTYLKALFMQIMETKEEPKEVVGWVNSVCYGFFRQVKKYATVNFVVIDEEQIRYTCGGGFGMVLHDGETTFFRKRDHFIGLRDKRFHQYEIPFREGDLLALYTDGIVESQNGKNQDYTVARLNKLIVDNASKSPQEIVDLCKDDYERFRSADSDDITLLILRRKGSHGD